MSLFTEMMEEESLKDIEIERLNKVISKQEKYLDAQIRCYNRKINNILGLKKQGRCLTEKERRQLKYEIGRKDECVKMKNHLIKLLDIVGGE